MVLPVNVNHPRLKKVQSLSGPETQIITGAVSAIFRKRSSLSRSAASARLALGDVVNRSNQMGTSACVVKDRRDADFAGQPPGRVIRCFFPTHDGIFFDRLLGTFPEPSSGTALG